MSYLRHPAFGAALALVFIVAALALLHSFVGDVDWPHIKQDMSALPWRDVALAIGCTAASFTALSLFDVTAVETIAPGRISRWVAAIAGASGFAISNLIGFSWLSGGALRMRIYAGLGLDFVSVTKIIASAWLPFWMGLPLVTGVALLLNPSDMLSVLVPPGFQRMAGAILLTVLGGFLVWLARRERTLRLGGLAIRLPTPRIALVQMAAYCADIVVSALVLYVLLPSDLASDPSYFLFAYIAAITIGLVSHSPGGVGVFEATMVAALGAGGRSDIFAALALYRIIYNLLPFLLATVSLAGVYTWLRRREVRKLSGFAYRLVQPLVPPVAGTMVLIAGSMLILSGNLPAEADRLGILNDLLPLPFIEVSHLIGSVAGLLLLIVARGLYRKQRQAWNMAALLLLAGFFASLAKGLDWEEAVAALTVLGMLAIFRPAFYRGSALPVFHLTWRWAIGIVILLAMLTWIGIFAYSQVPYRNELWWQFALDANASRFLRTALAVPVILAAVLINSLINATSRALAAEPVPDRVRELLAASPNSEANIALSGDKRFLISKDGEAFLCYADTGRTFVAKGDPVGNRRSGERLIWNLLELADKMGRRCAYYGVSSEYLSAYLEMGHTVLKIGEVARVDLGKFDLEGSKKKDFRYAEKRARRDGFVFEVVEAAHVPAILPELRRVSDAWLASKQGDEKSFAVGAFREAYLVNFDHAVLRQAATGRIVAFANLWKGAGLAELSTDLMRHDPAAPGFVMDALFAELLLWARDRGYRWFSLGAAPFSGMEQHYLVGWWSRLANLIYRHGNRFYRFGGLREFKDKFDPVWTANFLAVPGGLSAPQILYEINVLISGGIRGLMR
ncbi:MAG: bifunctional lysylphosphatidylglycerol flippase/synthetase MprF [Flavobacteriaceae bacterium]